MCRPRSKPRAPSSRSISAAARPKRSSFRCRFINGPRNNESRITNNENENETHRPRADMSYPADLKYTKEHEWIRVEGDTGAIGITDFAQQQLGDVVYVELPDVGSTITAGSVFGTI